MSVEDFTGLGDCIRLFTRTGAGFTSTGDETEITGWTDDSVSSVDATMRGGVGDRPEHEDNPLTGTVGPAAEYETKVHGFNFGLNLGDNTWTIGFAISASALSGFSNIFSSTGGSSEGSLYTNGALLTYEEAGTESTGFSLSTNTPYTIVMYSNATNYRCIVRDNEGTVLLDDSFTSIGTPTNFPTGLITNHYGGSGVGWQGVIWAMVVYSADKFTDDAALHSALREEIGTYVGTTAANGLKSVESITGNIGTAAVTGTIAETGLVGTEAVVGDVDVAGTVAEIGLVGTEAAVGDVDVAGTVAEIGLVGAETVVASSSVAGTIAESGLLGAESGEVGVGYQDDFEGVAGALFAWYPFGESDLPDVTQANGRYLAELDDNTGNITLWFHNDTGRLDCRWVPAGTEIIWTNIGAGTSDVDTQTAPPTTGDPFVFCGFHVNSDLDNPAADSAHVVCGHRGGVHYTIETKETLSGSSTVTDIGFNALSGLTRADLRLVYNSNGDLDAYWRVANSSDSWTALPWPVGTPNISTGAYIGIITYASGTQGVPFVGTCDAVAEVTGNNGIAAETGLIGTDTVVGDVDVAGTATETGLIAAAALVGDVAVTGTSSEFGLIGTDAIVGAAVISGVANENGRLGQAAVVGDVDVGGTVAEIGQLGQEVGVADLEGFLAGTAAETGLIAVDAVVGDVDVAGTAVANGLRALETVVGDVLVAGTVTETGRQTQDALTGDSAANASVAETGLLGSVAAVGDLPVSGVVAATGQLGQEVATGGPELVAVVAENGRIGRDAIVGSKTLAATIAETGRKGQEVIIGPPLPVSGSGSAVVKTALRATVTVSQIVQAA